MRAVIIGVGSELIDGFTTDLNTVEIARSLSGYALEVLRTVRVVDDLAAIANEVARARQDAELVIVTGGLGPTPDDVTREGVAAALGQPLVLDPAMLDWVVKRFAGRAMPESNHKQAQKPAAAEWIPNSAGTAPGWWWREPAQVVVLPGPPPEWRPMWQSLLPQLQLPQAAGFRRVIKTYGIGESLIAEKLGPLFSRAEIQVGTYPRSSGVEIVIRAQDPARAAEQAEAIRQKLAEFIYGEEEDTLPAAAIAALSARSWQVATLESLTGGLVSSLLTDVPGASNWVQGGAVVYTPEAKIALGVDREIVRTKGTVSPEAASAMAEAARSQFQTEVGLATTGVAGPTELEGQPVGTLYLGLATPAGTTARLFNLPPVARQDLKERAAYLAIYYLYQQAKAR